LREHFGRRKLRSISYGDIEKFKSERLQTPTKPDIARHERELKDNPAAELISTRTLATAHRELALLRAILRVAWREGWIPKSPFDAGKPLITVADEKKRERILTRDEETRLLNACDAPMTLTYTRLGKQITAQVSVNMREHLKPILICALDTGMRHGEMLKLCWRDVDFEKGIITVAAFNTKTMRERHVAMTTRLTLILQKLFEMSPKDPDALVFNIRDNVSKSYTAVRRIAGLPDVRFHDLRHTAATRLVQGHLPLAEVGRILGHTTPATTYRYVNANIETALRAAAALDAFHAETYLASNDSVMIN
jgi:integrase